MSEVSDIWQPFLLMKSIILPLYCGIETFLDAIFWTPRITTLGKGTNSTKKNVELIPLDKGIPCWALIQEDWYFNDILKSVFHNLNPVLLLLFGMDNYDYTLPSEKIAFIAYNIGVYETVQKFGESIIKGKIAPKMDISKIAEVLSESYSFYDSEIISQIVNAMIRQNKESTSIIGNVTSKDVDQVMRQLKTSGVSLPWSNVFFMAIGYFGFVIPNFEIFQYVILYLISRTHR